MPSKGSVSQIRCAQCWQDADTLLEALAVKETDVCLSIASAGDNALALVSCKPARVIAIDPNEAQMACVALRVAAYRELEHGELLELIGSSPSKRRPELYQRCRPLLEASARDFWDAHSKLVENGIGSGGKFEKNFALFRKHLLPFAHKPPVVDRLLAGGSYAARKAFYDSEWDTPKWRMLANIMLSPTVLGMYGRNAATYEYVQGEAARAMENFRYAVAELEPAANPYLQWILTGTHKTALPFALRPENFDAIRSNLDSLEFQCRPLVDFLKESGKGVVDKYDLGDFFEHVPPQQYPKVLDMLAKAGRSGGRMAYWNMLADRRRPEALALTLKPLSVESDTLYRRDKSFFYSDLVIEEII